MYSKSEASQIKRAFWTSFGMYMKPLKNVEGNTINWLNYKTGIRHIYFRMDAGKRQASIAIELKHPSTHQRTRAYEQFEQLKLYLEQILMEGWEWQSEFYDEDGGVASRIFIQLGGVNVFNKADWPAIISFLKERIVKLDVFWNDVRQQFEGVV